MESDLLTDLFKLYRAFVEMLPTSTFSFLCRWVILLGLPFTIGAVAFHRYGSRLLYLQLLGIILALLVAWQIPVNLPILDNTHARQFLLPVLLLSALFFPSFLSFYLSPRAHTQVRVRQILYGSFAMLFLLNHLLLLL